MELKRYFFIVMRYWLVVLILTGIGLLAAGQYLLSNKPTFQAVTRVNLTQLPSPGDIYSGLYAVQAAEYATDEFTSIVGGTLFLTQVSNRLGEGGLNLSPDELKGMLEVEKKHRILNITVHSANAENAAKVAQIVGSTLESSASDFVKPRQVVAKVVDVAPASSSGGRNLLLAVVRVLAGFIAGVFLAFMLSYLDTTLKTKEDVQEALGLPVLSSVPSFKVPPVQAIVGGPSAPKGGDPISARLASLQEQASTEQISSRK